MQALVNAEVDGMMKLNSTHGALQMVEKHIRDLKGLPSPEEINVIQLGREITLA
jgi:hypothetical protein